MELIVDELTSSTNWISSDITKCLIHGVNQLPDYIANENTGSLILHFLGTSINSYAQKTFTAIDVSAYNELVLSVYSTRNKFKGTNYNDLDDFCYKIAFNNTMSDLMLPVYDTLTPISFDLTGITSIDRIKITANQNLNPDYLVISHCIVCKDEVPLDIYKACKTKIETQLTSKIGAGILSATSAGITAGDSFIYLNGNKNYIEKYAIIIITNGVHTETHQISENTEDKYTFTSLYDGMTMLYNYTTANVYLKIPVEYGTRQKEIILPGISIDGMTPRPIARENKIEYEANTYHVGRTVNQRRRPQIYEWEILFHCESRHDELLAIMSECVRKAIATELLWINGKKYNVYFDANPVFMDAIEGWNQIPKIVYSMKIEIKEFYYDNVLLPNTTTLNYTLSPESN